ncbi:unnamed protein product, partial [Ectocarpus sp. 8 AP-2014]
MGTGGRGGEEGGRSAAPAASAPPATPAVEMVRVESTALQAESSITQDATDTQWGNVVGGTGATSGAAAAAAAEAAAAGGLSRGEVAAPAPPARRKKWSGKGWLVSRAKEEAEGRAKSQNRETGTDARLSSMVPSMAVDDDEGTSMMPTVAAMETGREAGLTDTALVNGKDGERGEGTESPLADEEGGKATGLEDTGGGVCATAKEELALYLLEAGATDDLVVMATAALFAAEPRCSLTEGTWKRWRQNLDGLRSKGFSGADVCNMLALCPQLLALDFEGQVVPTMELLRQLGMRPTDVRRVIRKAPEVLAPRPDGSTAAEAVDV